MTSTTIPRSQTGLVPTSHQLRMDRIASPDNYRKLPPRPPPKIYPYRGDAIHYSRQLKKERKNDTCSKKPLGNCKQVLNKCKNQVNIDHSIRTPGKSTKSNEVTTKMDSRNHNSQSQRKKKQWDIYTSDNEMNQFSVKEKQVRQNSASAILNYIRTSSKHRLQLNQLEQKLDSEIEAEENVGKIDECEYGVCLKRDDNEVEKSLDEWDNSCFMADLSDFKASMLRICNESKATDERSNSYEFDSAAVPSHSNNDTRGVMFSTFDKEDLTERFNQSIQDDRNLKNTVQVRDYLSLQSDEFSLSESMNAPLVSKKFSHDDMMLQLNETDASHLHEKGNKFKQSSENYVEGVTPNSVSISNVDDDTPLPNKNLWDDLSKEQLERIRSKMIDFISSGVNTEKSKPSSVENDKSIPGEVIYKEKCSETVGQDNTCVSNIISLISEGLCTKIHALPDDDDKNRLSKDNCGKRFDLLMLKDNMPQPLSRPVHPFTLPLANDVKQCLEGGNTSQVSKD